jgi:bifunctional UDP-N-acetylglucosamine pyrophosphorylase/glucosamine-1-phosphate N-acetyltransferase
MINIIDPNNTYIDDTVTLGDNVKIYPNVVIEGNTTIGDNTIIYNGSYIKDANIGKNNIIYTSYIVGSELGDNNQIGPYANIREKNKIGNNNRLGSFVEFKENTIGNGNKIPHLSFVGNANVKNDVHMGCGTITVNKAVNSATGVREETIIEDNAFIGCNANLVAPVTIGKNSVVAAGSTITEDVPDNSLAIARERQTNKENYYD